MSIASKFDSFFYLLENPDVLSAVNNNDFKDALSHFETFGHKESRQPNQLFNTTYYILNNPDVADALNSGLFKHAFEHYRFYGEAENRYPSSAFEGFDADIYLQLNPDVSAAVAAGFFDSALHHFIDFGQNEERLGGIGSGKILNLTMGADNLIGTSGSDSFVANVTTLQSIDKVNGRGGSDTLVISPHEQGDVHPHDIISVLSNSKSIERLSISANSHSTNNFSSFDSLDEIKLTSGRTQEDSAIEITLADHQSLILDSILDGDINKAVLKNGGIKINQLRSATEVDITINNVGSIGQNINNSLYIDLAGLNL